LEGRIELGHRGGIHRVGATSTAFYSKVTPSTGGLRWKWKLVWHQNPPPKPTSKNYFVYLFCDYFQTFLFFKPFAASAMNPCEHEKAFSV
jgi:hypothetical protein